MSDTWTIFIQISLVMPECINLILLLMAIYGMHHGIEIGHPLYAILFLNLIIALCFTLFDIVGFVFLPADKFMTLTNTNSGLSLFFHCTSWCITSIIRYIYIAHDDWIHSTIPSHKNQCRAAFVLAFIMSLFFAFPMYGYALFLGKCSIITQCFDFKGQENVLLHKIAFSYN